MAESRPKLLLHCCCAPCATHPMRLLSESFDVTAFFYNPNIQPQGELKARREEMVKLSQVWEFDLIVGREDTAAWFDAVRGLEDEPEGGRRCAVCYRLRMAETARVARERSFTHFDTTLSVSPHKKVSVIHAIGLEIQDETGVIFLASDFKKKDGFKISCQLSRDEGLYRQDYCGCVFSRRGTP